ncbi:hypothetical protein [Microtetraspora fusca]|uniref:hypothetical protein n=1 Tax=Microtetraspora fusca TaxID=1997 RepID=UPI0012FB88B0|nr:hypothetical protein [Microtetraspora fusca]
MIKRVVSAFLFAVLSVGTGACQVNASHVPSAQLSRAINELTAALTQTIEIAAEGAAPYAKQRTPWPCETVGTRAFSIGYDIKVKDPRAGLKKALAHWTDRGLGVGLDSSDREQHPEIVLEAPLFELSVHAFPERGELWIRGNTVCLAGEVPEDWRDVR